MEEYLTVYEAAVLFKVNPQTIRRYIKNGEIRAYKASRKVIRIRRKDFNNFVKRNPLS
jgi:excisionase family DNA binding protein